MSSAPCHLTNYPASGPEMARINLGPPQKAQRRMEGKRRMREGESIPRWESSTGRKTFRISLHRGGRGGNSPQVIFLLGGRELKKAAEETKLTSHYVAYALPKNGR